MEEWWRGRMRGAGVVGMAGDGRVVGGGVVGMAGMVGWWVARASLSLHS